MTEPNTKLRSSTTVNEQVWADQAGEAPLVAALAATLVEYRRYVGHEITQVGPEGVGPNWRMMARLEQLGG